MPTKYMGEDLSIAGYTDHNKKDIRNVAMQLLGTDITSPVDGLFFVRSDTWKVRVRLNGAWVYLATTTDIPTGVILSSLIDAKGDILIGTADDTVARKAVGADNTFLAADSAQSDGARWRLLTTTDVDELLATNDLTDWPRVAALDLNSQKITSMADGTASTDGATFGQLNSIVQGQKWKTIPVVAASTANGALATAFENGDSLDGVTLATGDGILLKDQTTSTEDGIYTVNASGAPTRRSDADTPAELTRATVLVLDGTVNKGRIYTQTATLANLATDAQTWAMTGDSTTAYSADESTLTLVGTQFSAKAAGITGTELAASVAGAGLTGGAGSALAVGAGTGVTVNANDVAIDTATVLRKAGGTLTGGANSEAKTHSLGNQWVDAFLVNNASPFDRIDCYYECTDSNTVTFYAASGQNLPAGYQWRVHG